MIYTEDDSKNDLSTAFALAQQPLFESSSVYIFWTCRDKPEAKKIIHDLLDKHLIACASLIPTVESIYRWEGKIEESQEVKVILKTIPNHFEAIQNTIQAQCSYDVPEIAQVEIATCSPLYLAWVLQETTHPRGI